MQAEGIETTLACILFGILSLGPGGHFHGKNEVLLRNQKRLYRMLIVS